MFSHDKSLEKAVNFSRFDKHSPFSTISEYPFLLDDVQWKTAEHYYQARKFKGLAYAEKIILAEDGLEAYQLGNRWLKRKASDWKAKRQLYMTRALFRKVKEYPAVAQTLLETGDTLLVETSQYDYFWGLGRDQRGENKLGKVWMDIRKKLLSEIST
jgi:ribA/ribD-fused uncharacterized protein